jgi:hypothetical protein
MKRRFMTQGYSKLDIDRGLGNVGVVGENRMFLDEF